MPRPKGSKNLPKNAQDLLARVVAEYEKQGKKVTVSIEDLADLTDEQKATIAEAVQTNPDLNIPNIFELENAEDENDNYAFQCGKCKEKLDGEDAICPHCGSTLRWQ